MLTPLILRLLQSKFAPDKAPIKLGSAYNVWSSRYSDLIEENRISSGRVQPVAIPRLWNPNIDFLYLSREHSNDDDKGKEIEKEKEKSEEKQEERLRERQKKWQDDLEEYKLAMKDDWENTKKQAYEKNKQKSIVRNQSWKLEIQKEEKENQSIKKEIQGLEEAIRRGVSVIDEKKELLQDTKEKIVQLQQAVQEFKSRSGWFSSLTDTDPKPALDEAILKQNGIEAQIKLQNEQNNAYTTEKEKLQQKYNKKLLKIINLKKNPPYNVDDKNKQWVQDNPEPSDSKLLQDFVDIYGEIPDGAPPQLDIDDLETNLNDSPLDLFDMDAIIEMEKMETINDDDDDEIKQLKEQINQKIEDKNVTWKDKVEWMYAQRQIFQSEYYAPTSIEDLLLKFRIRFKDWTGAETITINN